MIPEIENRFSYHKPHGNQSVRYEEIRSAAKRFAYVLERECPNSREKSTALTHLDAAAMFANAAIARNEARENNEKEIEGDES